MKQLPFLIFILLVGGLGAYLLFATAPTPTSPEEPEQSADTTAAQVARPEYGLTVPYREGPDGYTRITPEGAPQGDPLFTTSLVSTPEYDALRESDEAREGPPAITVSVYRNATSRPADEWIRESGDANFVLALGDITTEEIGGREYATYRYDGLYTNDAYVYVRDGYAYLFTAAYADTASPLREDLRTMLAGSAWSEPTLPASLAHNAIVLDYPTPGAIIASPLTVTGQARGSWFFEASFPFVLTDWDGRIIAEGYATADGDWMTTEFVPFSGTLEFTRPAYGERGTLILEKANASGLPEHADAVEVSVRFE